MQNRRASFDARSWLRSSAMIRLLRNGLACTLGLLLATSLNAATSGNTGGTSTGSIRISVHIPTTVIARTISPPPALTAARRTDQLCLRSEQAHPFKVFVLTNTTRRTTNRGQLKTQTLMISVDRSGSRPACESLYTIKQSSESPADGYPYTVLIAPE